MEALFSLWNELQARHSEFFGKRWDTLSAKDAKTFTRLERDIMEVKAALASPEPTIAPELQVLLDRLTRDQITDTAISGKAAHPVERVPNRSRVPRQHS